MLWSAGVLVSRSGRPAERDEETAHREDTVREVRLVVVWDVDAPDALGAATSSAQATLGPGARVAEILEGVTVTPRGATLDLSLDRGGVFVNGAAHGGRVTVRPDDTVRVGPLLLLVCRRPSAGAERVRGFPFGAADEDGLVGESPAMWRLRAKIRQVAQLDLHTLVTGPSGTGKELVARALRRHSRRREGPWVATSSANIPDSLVEAELFGQVRGYPSRGAAAREGLVGAAHGGVLFLDEIGDLRPAAQPSLLRVLDSGGEYRALGASASRQSDFRLIAATNRPLASLRDDLRARFAVKVAAPSLGERREDIPLLLRHLYLELAAGGMVAPLASPAGRVPVELVDALVRHGYRCGVRELLQLLFLALEDGAGQRLALGPETRAALRFRGAPVKRCNGAPTRAEVLDALLGARGRRGAAAHTLGISRHALYRRMKKLAIEAPRAGGE